MCYEMSLNKAIDPVCLPMNAHSDTAKNTAPITPQTQRNLEAFFHSLQSTFTYTISVILTTIL